MHAVDDGCGSVESGRHEESPIAVSQQMSGTDESEQPGVIGLWLTGQNLSVPASVGFIALFGIALENGMVLVTYLNELVEEGVPILKASVEGAVTRVRPVLMTAMTTALGLIPLLFSSGTGSEVQRPLATVVVGGLVTSTALTLLVIPALYRWFANVPESEDYLSEAGAEA